MLRFALWSLLIFCVLGIGALVTGLVLVSSAPPARPPERNVFGFGEGGRAQLANQPPILRLRARDGESLAYRFYDAPSERILIFVHGSSYHGGGYHDLAAFVSAAGAAKVVLPNLRGHFLSGQQRGDVDHIGQYEEDLVDLIAMLRAHGHKGPIILGGHSSGGGFVLRHAGGQGPSVAPIAAYLALAPIIPQTAAVRGGDAGGWNSIHLKRIIGLVILNIFGVHGFDGLPIIAFNKPAANWDGTETLAYSWRLNQSYHPRRDHAGDVKGLGAKSLILVGDGDEAVDGQGLSAVLKQDGYAGGFEILPGVSHFGIFSQPKALQRVLDYVTSVPAP